MKVLISRQAQNDLEMIYEYISSEGYPETAYHYINRILEFINELGLMSNIQFKPCRNRSWQKRGYECSVFEKTFIIAYKRDKSELKVMKIIHGTRIK